MSGLVTGNTIDITLYLPGEDKEDAISQCFLFDSYIHAEEYCRDNPGQKVFCVTAIVDLDSVEEMD